MFAKQIAVSCFLSLLTIISFGQNRRGTCEDIHPGLFYYYPKNTTDRYTLRMEGHFEHQTNLKTGDTTLSLIKWKKNCSFSEKYITGDTKMTNEEFEILEHNTFVYKVTSITRDYYTFSMHMGKSLLFPVTEDTLWYRPQTHPTNSPLFRIIGSFSPQSEHFKDTSKYAVLYLYRPGKVTNFLNFYPVYMNNIEMCIAENNSGYIFKILKEGRMEIKGALFNHPGYVTLPVQFGHTYYVKTKVHLGGTKNTTRAVLEIVDAKTGKEGFARVKVRS